MVDAFAGCLFLIAALSVVLALPTALFGDLLLVRILGKDHCVEPGGESGCSLAWVSWIFSVLGAFFLSSAYGAWGLLGLACGPLLALGALGLQLRFGEWGWRRKTFVLRPERVEDRHGQRIRPTFVEPHVAYYCTGCASGYCLYSLTLYDENGQVHTNGYVSGEHQQRDLARLCDQFGATLIRLPPVRIHDASGGTSEDLI